MTDIKQKALALVNEIEREEGATELTPGIMRLLVMDEALCRAIEQREAFRQEVSDEVGDTLFMVETHCDGEALALVSNRLLKFIIPKPDPLVEAFDAVWPGIDRTMVKAIRAALEARGLEIREKNDD